MVKKPTRNAILSLTIREKSVLYASYMSFLRNGGLFIPTSKAYHLGDEIFILLKLMEDPEKMPLVGKVVWITPQGAQGNRVAGIGVEFTNDEYAVRSKIENYLAGSLQSEVATHTM